MGLKFRVTTKRGKYRRKLKDAERGILYDEDESDSDGGDAEDD